MQNGRWTRPHVGNPMQNGRWTCPNVANTIQNGRWTCPHAGNPMQNGRWTCPNVANPMQNGRWTCPHVGNPMRNGRWTCPMWQIPCKRMPNSSSKPLQALPPTPLTAFYLNPSFRICKYVTCHVRCILHSIYIPEYHITYLLLKTDSVTCEKRCFHSALGGGAVPSPQSPPPAFFIFKPKLVNTLVGVGMMMWWTWWCEC